MSLVGKLINKLLASFYNIRKRSIPETDHVARYLRPMDLDNSSVLATGFQYKKHRNGELKEKELSVNWLEFFSKDSTIQENVNQVCIAFKKKGYGVKVNGRFTALNNKTICDEVKKGTSEHIELVSLVVKHTAQGSDLSHSSILGMPFDPDGELLVSTILANLANETDLFPAKI